jgi:hypothetical protein
MKSGTSVSLSPKNHLRFTLFMKKALPRHGTLARFVLFFYFVIVAPRWSDNF